MKKKFMIQFIKKTMIVCGLLAVTACSSGPRVVHASLPLVSYSQERPDKEVVPQQYWSMLADESQSYLPHDQYTITLGAIYSSALGLTCRELVFAEKNQVIKKRIACENHFLNENNKEDKGWFLEKEIFESSNYIEM